MTTTTTPTFASNIERGLLDHELADIARALKTRQEALRKTRTVMDFPLGSSVVVNDYCGTQYLRGETATVTGRKRTKLVIQLDRPMGRFVRLVDGVAHSVDITVPTSLVDLV
jgi:hypothetical protein